MLGPFNLGLSFSLYTTNQQAYGHAFIISLYWAIDCTGTKHSTNAY